MAWNEPGRGQDPWRGRKGGGGDLDAFIRELSQRFGGGGNGGGGESAATFGLLGAFAVLLWLLFGFYQVDDAQKAVVQRFGRFVEETGPGLHWRMPWPVDTVAKVNTNQIRQFPYKTVMLTGDETLVSLDLEVQFRAADAKAFLFNVRDPEATLGQVVSSALREGIGKTQIDDIIDGIPPEIVTEIRTLTQSSLDAYGAGITVSSFNFKGVQFPDQVQDAQNDAIKAREDKETAMLAAQAYANDILPKARGQAAREIQEAEAHKARVVAQAEGETARFTKLLAEYKKAPGVTRERLYLDAMEQVLGANAKVIVNTKGQGNVLYLPLDQLRRLAPPALAPNATPSSVENAPASEARTRDRGGR
jgi:membrane protease subunit HflK